ncbi:MAG: hypothetical protein B7Y35_06120 [Sphingomonadales bacterium 28-64-96]|nr:MAG: hypothetical protein B7Y35_06120 [Sphingomonadales bacterium 28-64-96]
MPAPTAADIARATRPASIITSEDSAVLTRQPGARDGLASPRVGFWDSAADAAAVLTAAAALIGTERRRFQVQVGAVLALDASTATPAVQLIDAGLAVNAGGLTARIVIDDDAETTTLEVMA